jgi:hypothetical protein
MIQAGIVASISRWASNIIRQAKLLYLTAINKDPVSYYPSRQSSSFRTHLAFLFSRA